MWLRVPGTPLSILTAPQQNERLPGTYIWAPKDVVEQVGGGLADDQSLDQIIETAADQGLKPNVGFGAGAGAIGGALAGRGIGGEAAVAPLKTILRKGINASTLRGLSKLPTSMKVLPAVGGGLGVLGGLANWEGGRDHRRAQAAQVARGLLSEDVIQQHALQTARRSSNPVLQGLPTESATEATPLTVTQSDAGA